MRAIKNLGVRNGLDESTNTVQRMSLAIDGPYSMVIIQIISDDMHQSKGTNGHYDVAVYNQEACLLDLQISLLSHEVPDVRIEAEIQLFILKQKIGCMTNNIAQLSSRTAFVCRTNGSKRRQIIMSKDKPESETGMAMAASPPIVLEAYLIPCLGTIHDLWKGLKLISMGLSPLKIGLQQRGDWIVLSTKRGMLFRRKSQRW